MTESVLTELAAELAPEIDLEVRFTGAMTNEMRQWLGDRCRYCGQGGGDLGARLSRAFQDAFQEEARLVIALGSDVPTLTSTILRSALDELRENDVVIGPTTDGGYYLLGMRAYHPELFAEISWGTEVVFTQTCAAAHRANLRFGELPTLQDIDRPEDLIHVQELLES